MEIKDENIGTIVLEGIGENPIDYKDLYTWNDKVLRYFNNLDKIISSDVQEMQPSDKRKLSGYIQNKYSVLHIYLISGEELTLETYGGSKSNKTVGFIFCERRLQKEWTLVEHKLRKELSDYTDKLRRLENEKDEPERVY